MSTAGEGDYYYILFTVNILRRKVEKSPPAYIDTTAKEEIKAEPLKINDVEAIEDVGPSDDFEDVYDMVDAVATRTDDPSIPALTFRVWVLGLFWNLVSAFFAAFNLFRTTPVAVSPSIALLLSYPMGVFMAKVLPSGILNPGPFSVKEHALIFIWASACSSYSYAILNIMGQKYVVSQTNLPAWGCILFLIATQCFGFGLAGFCRRYNLATHFVVIFINGFF
jgi:hypothetical protein